MLTRVPVLFSNVRMAIKTRGDLLRGELTFALAKAVKSVRGLRQALTRDEWEAVADRVVRQIAAKPYDSLEAQ